MARDSIICIFCGKIAKIMEQDDLGIVVCPKCKRETELVAYQDIFDEWLGDVRKEVVGRQMFTACMEESGIQVFW